MNRLSSRIYKCLSDYELTDTDPPRFIFRNGTLNEATAYSRILFAIRRPTKPFLDFRIMSDE